MSDLADDPTFFPPPPLHDLPPAEPPDDDFLASEPPQLPPEMVASTPPPPPLHPGPRPGPRAIVGPRIVGPNPNGTRLVGPASQITPAQLKAKPLSKLGSSSVVVETIIGELLQTGEIGLWHGSPRSMKSLILLRVLIDLALGTSPALGEPRFSIARPWRCLYFTEEDSAALLERRRDAILAGLGIPLSSLPDDNLKVVVRQGLDFDSEDSRATILREIREANAELVAFDPLRGFTGKVDQGPSELRPIVRFLRHIQRETPAKTLILIHHDTKRPRDGVDKRSRPERASGGAIFSISDSPISFDVGASGAARRQETGGAVVFCFPSSYKDRPADPAPFRVEIVTDRPADAADGASALSFKVSRASSHADLDQQLLDYVREFPGATTRQIRDALGGDNNLTTARLTQLVKEGLVVFTLGPRQAKYHYLKEANIPDQTTQPVTPPTT